MNLYINYAREHLTELGLPFEYIDIDDDESAMAWVERQNDGKKKLPTVDVGGLVLSIPSNAELDVALHRQGHRPSQAEG